MNAYLKQRALEMTLNPTWGEKVFGERLLYSLIPFETQVIIGRYIVDFVVGKTVFEIDGSVHDGNELKDLERTKEINKLGYKVIRIQNCDVKSFPLSSARAAVIKPKHKPRKSKKKRKW